LVKKMYLSPWIADKFVIENVDKKGMYYPLLFNKLISPITIYRWLYLKLVEQKHYFTVKSNMKGEYTYAQYKRDLRKSVGKAEFQRWFFENVLAGDDKGEFNSNYVSIATIDQNMVIGDKADLEGPTNKNEGLVQLLGGAATFSDMETVAFRLGDGSPVHFPEMLKDDRLIKEYINILDDKHHPQHRAAKVSLAFFKANISAWLKQEVFSPAGLSEMMEDPTAYATAVESMRATRNQSPNVTSADGVQTYAMAGGHGASPVKAPQ
jgi:hypothetical protein